MTQRNAIIMAAGTSSRFVPLSVERPKGLVEVKGEILIERQIRQLKEAGITDITLVVGYKAEMFASLIRVIEKLDNTFICSSDNYFPENVFTRESVDSYYSALYAEGKTNEYCLITDAEDQITDVKVGGHDSWYMVGHVFFNHEFSEKFRKLMIKEYCNETTKQGYWEDLYIRYIDQLPKMKINRYKEGDIQEFDSLDELRMFDESYKNDTRSSIVKQICKQLEVEEACVHAFRNIKHKGNYLQFQFKVYDDVYEYNAENGIEIKKI